MASLGEDRREFLTCALCLDIFENPKLLPCSHTFCLKCLERLTKCLATPSFPCPMCREPIKVPPGGAAVFKANRYIMAEDLARANDWTLCLFHDMVLEFFCNQCAEPICRCCKLNDHEGHPTIDIATAATKAAEDLSHDTSRLQSAVAMVMLRVDKGEEERKWLQESRAGLELEIRARHQLVVSAADASRDAALTALESLCQAEDERLAALTQARQHDLEQLLQLQERVNSTLDGEQHCELVTVAREMRFGRGSVDAVNKLTSVKVSPAGRQFLSFSQAGDELQSQIGHFIGSVSSEAADCPPPVTVQQQFVCGQASDTEVFSLCVEDSGDVAVSYALQDSRRDAPSEIFSNTGKRLSREEDKTGPVSCICFTGEMDSWLFAPDSDDTCARTKSPRAIHFSLTHTAASDTASVERLEVSEPDSDKLLVTAEFGINVGPPRAIDVDDSEEGELVVVVVAEAKPPQKQRQVRLYRKPRSNPLATYKPQGPDFQPSDVCFFRLDGQQVLLVADQGGSSVHVVSVRRDTFTFLHYLAMDSGLLVNPTALNRDGQGRLWVACEGGKIFKVTPGGQGREAGRQEDSVLKDTPRGQGSVGHEAGDKSKPAMVEEGKGQRSKFSFHAN